MWRNDWREQEVDSFVLLGSQPSRWPLVVDRDGPVLIPSDSSAATAGAKAISNTIVERSMRDIAVVSWGGAGELGRLGLH